MLALTPTTATERSRKSIHATIQNRINSIYEIKVSPETGHFLQLPTLHMSIVV